MNSTIGRQAVMAIGTIAAALQAALAGDDLRSAPSTERDRMTRCATCPELRRDKAGMSCAACGCRLPFKAKVQAAKCPLNRWPA